MPESERCEGWRTGKCTAAAAAAAEGGAAAGGGVEVTCPDCGMAMVASSDEIMAQVLAAHKKASLLGMGASQCAAAAKAGAGAAAAQ